MDTRTFESIKEKIKTLENKQARSEGILSTIEETWRNEYNIGSYEEALARKQELETKLAALEQERDALFSELKAVTNWGLV